MWRVSRPHLHHNLLFCSARDFYAVFTGDKDIIDIISELWPNRVGVTSQHHQQQKGTSNIEDSINPLFTLACTILPCLALIGAIGAGIAYFISRRKKTNPAPAAHSKVSAPIPSVPKPGNPLPVTPVPAPAAPSQVSTPIPSDTNPGGPLLASPDPADAASGQEFTFGGLTPSELVVLRAEAFSPAAGLLNSWKVIGGERKVSGPTLAQTALAAAFLSLEHAGQIRLQQGRRKATLGLREVDTLYITPIGAANGMPEGSYEAWIISAAQRLQGSQRNYVQQIVYDLLQEDAGLVWDWALRLVYRGLAQRGVLESTREKGLLSSGLVRYSLPPATVAAIVRQDVAGVQMLLDNCKNSRPALWQSLNQEIKNGFASRHESPEVD